MSTFEGAIDVVIRHEALQHSDGSWLYWVNNPKDAGGETAWGISTLIIDRENISAAELGVDAARLARHVATFRAKQAKNPLPNPEPEGLLKNVTIDSAKGIYKRLFWDRFGYAAITDQTVATKIFDFGVNASPHQAALEAQRACCDCGQVIATDGSLGPISFAAINKVPPAAFISAMSSRLAGYYDLIISHHPDWEVFRTNWHKRAAWPA